MYKELLIWLLGLALVIAVAYGYARQRSVYDRYVQFRQDEQGLEEVRRDIEALRDRVEEARDRVQKLEQDPVEIEAAIRRIRRLTRDGETIFHVERQPPQETDLDQPEAVNVVRIPADPVLEQ